MGSALWLNLESPALRTADEKQGNLPIEMGKNQSKLSKEDKDLLHRETGMDKTDIEEWYEGFKRDCPSGELNKAKFVAMYSKMFPRGNAEAFAENIFRTFDTNKNGTVDFREFMLGTQEDKRGKAEELFSKMDQNADGTVSQDQFVAVCKQDQDLLDILTKGC